MSYPATPPPKSSASKVLEQEFLPMRSRMLDLASALDRIDRAGGATDDPRMIKLRSAFEALLAPGPGRAERVQLLFSLPYETGWREQFQLIDESSSVG